MAESRRAELATDTVRRLSASLRGAELYEPGHPLVTRNVLSLAEILNVVHGYAPVLTIGFVGSEIVVGDMPLSGASQTMARTMKHLGDQGIQRISFERGVSPEELIQAVRVLSGASAGPGDGGGEPANAQAGNALEWFARNAERVPHIRVGGLSVEKKLETASADMASVREMYAGSVKRAEDIWESATEDGEVDTGAVRRLVNDLAQAVTYSSTAVMALTALKKYDNYTFTHMVNVSILVMAQARSLGIDGTLLREFGLAGLMHDIGKVRTPKEILNKPGALTEEEFAAIRRHPVDGAMILRRAADMPPLAAIVAFEHHLRLDGRGYPASVKRAALNIGTQMSAIADLYDAMRSKRGYQEAFPTDRVMSVLQADDGSRFDPALVRRFAQIVGIYPVGNLVRLDTGDVAVVTKVKPSDPRRPLVRLVIAPDGSRYEGDHKVRLWEAPTATGQPSAIVSPLDPSEFGIDPLVYV